MGLARITGVQQRSVLPAVSREGGSVAVAAVAVVFYALAVAVAAVAVVIYALAVAVAAVVWLLS